MKDRLAVGDLVLWRGSWGSEPEKLARVVELTKTAFEHEKSGENVESILWSEVACSIMILDNDRWCYGDAIRQFDGPEPVNYKPCPAEPIRCHGKRTVWEKVMAAFHL